MKLGADVDQLDDLCRTFRSEAAKIQQTISLISSKVHGAWWEGTDGRNFRTQWDSEFRARLSQVHQALETTGAAVSRQASQQRSVSNN
jgi:hypothetical protein